MSCAGFTMLPSYYEALRPLPDDQRLQMYDAIMDYAFLGKEPEHLPPILAGYFHLMRPNIDNSVKHYSASVTNGKKGGRPPRKKPSGNPTETQQKPSKNPAETVRRRRKRIVRRIYLLVRPLLAQSRTSRPLPLAKNALLSHRSKRCALIAQSGRTRWMHSVLWTSMPRRAGWSAKTT